MEADARAQPTVTPLDVIGLAFAALGFLFAAVAALRIQPAFVKMFEDLPILSIAGSIK